MISFTSIWNIRSIRLSVLLLFILVANGVAFAQSGSDEVQKKQKIQKAVESLKQGRLAESQKLLEELAQSDPLNPLVHYNLGNVYYLQEKYPKAIARFKQVVKQDSPLKYPSYLFLSRSYRKMERPNTALDFIEKLERERLPKNLRALVREEKAELQKALIRQGIALYKQEQYEQALTAFNRALDLRPSDHALMFKAMTLKKLGNTKEAEKHFTEIYRTTNNTNLRNNAQILLEKPSKPSRKNWWLYAEGSLGYDSNVFADGSEEDPISGIGFRVFGAGGIRLLSESSRTWDLIYSFTWEEIFDQGPARLIYNNLKAPLNYYPDQGVFRITPSFSHQVISSTNFRAVPGIELTYEADRRDPASPISWGGTSPSIPIFPIWMETFIRPRFSGNGH